MTEAAPAGPPGVRGGSAPWAIASGVLFWAAFPPVGLWPLSFAGGACLVEALLRARSLRSAAAAAFLAKLAFAPVYWYLWGVHPLMFLLFACNISAGWALFGAAFHAARRWRGEAVAVALVPFLWPVFDWLSPRFCSIPSELVDWPVAFGHTFLRGLAPYTGFYGLSALAAAVSAAPRLWRTP